MGPVIAEQQDKDMHEPLERRMLSEDKWTVAYNNATIEAHTLQIVSNEFTSLESKIIPMGDLIVQTVALKAAR